MMLPTRIVELRVCHVVTKYTSSGVGCTHPKPTTQYDEVRGGGEVESVGKGACGMRISGEKSRAKDSRLNEGKGVGGGRI